MTIVIPALAAALLLAAATRADAAAPTPAKKKRKGKRKRKVPTPAKKKAAAKSDGALAGSIIPSKVLAEAKKQLAKMMKKAKTAAQRRRAAAAARKLAKQEAASDAARDEVKSRASKRAGVKRKARGLKARRRRGKGKKVRRRRRRLTPKRAARLLRSYLVASKDFGSRRKPSRRVAKYQRAMKKLKADGIVGRKTAARAKQLGVTLPSREGAPTRTTVAPTTPRYVPYEVIPTAVTPAAAAARRGHYLPGGVNPGPRAPRSGEVAKSQRTMGGGIAVDGIYGPQTQGRARALGVSIPSRSTFVASRLSEG
jgi:hypothetical protein